MAAEYLRHLAEAEFTESEQLLYDGFMVHRERFRWVQILRGMTLCLQCDQFFEGPRGFEIHHTRRPYCKVDKGTTAKPDFVLAVGKPYDINAPPEWETQKAVVRVDGGIHTKNRKHMMWDYHQTERLKELEYKVFIVKNEELETELCCNAIAFYILSMLYDDNLYQQYVRSGDMQQRCRRPA